MQHASFRSFFPHLPIEGSRGRRRGLREGKIGMAPPFLSLWTEDSDRLFRVELDYELVVYLDWDLVPFRHPYKLAGELFFVLLKVRNVESRMTEEVALELLVLP